MFSNCVAISSVAVVCSLCTLISSYENDSVLIHHINTYPASVNDVDSNLRTPLMLTAQQGRLDVMGVLLAKRANVDARDNEGYTPLHYACKNGNPAICKLLISHGADVAAEAGEHCVTPMHVIGGSMIQDVVDVIIAGGGDLEAADSSGRKPEVYWKIQKKHNKEQSYSGSYASSCADVGGTRSRSGSVSSTHSNSRFRTTTRRVSKVTPASGNGLGVSPTNGGDNIIEKYCGGV